MTAACPADRELERLLADQLSDGEEATLEAHVAGCAACQVRMDQLTRGPLTLATLQNGNFPDYQDTLRPTVILQQMAGLLPEQVRLLEQEYAMVGGNGTGHPTPTKDPRNDMPAPDTGPRFTILGPHAEGGLGRVHLARDEQLRRTVALKEIRPERASDPRIRQRFLNEAEITGQLEHPGIVPVYALERDSSRGPVYAMRFIQGRTLGDAIEAHHKRPTALGLRELLQRFIRVCQTVAYAHSKGVIHRDLKPDNVMLGDYGETLIVDWGLAKRLGDRDDSFDAVAEPPTAASDVPPVGLAQTVLAPTDRVAGSGQLTAAGTVMGTPAYMAPEQACGEQLSPAADVYALGAVLFTVLTGKAPYRGSNTIEVLRKVAAGELRDVAVAPRALNAIYIKAMARDPRLRYLTAAELARDVECWLADEPVGAYREPWLDRTGRWARRHRTLVTSLGVAVVLLLAAGVGTAWWRSRVALEHRFEQAQKEEERQLELARQAEERRLEEARTAEQVGALLDRCASAVVADDAAAARIAVADAEARARYPGADHLQERLESCRVAADLLAELDRIDDLRWEIGEGKLLGPGQLLKEWPGAFARLGIVIGRTPPVEAAAAIAGSPARERLLAALDQWLVYAPERDRAALAALLAAADADRFRDAVRAAVRKSDTEAIRALAAKSEALTQPARFAAALGSIAAVPVLRRQSILETAASARPRAFAVLMTAGILFPINNKPTAIDRAAWFRAAVAARPGNAVARNNLGTALREAGDSSGAITEYRAAIALNPKYATAHLNLGNALRDRGDVVGGVAEYRTAIVLNSKLAIAYRNLGSALLDKGDLEEAVTVLREALRLDASDTTAKRALAEVERMRALLGKLSDLAAGRSEPASAVEATELSKLCRPPYNHLFAASARFYAKACAADPKYATDNATFGIRYNAARSAALAGSGRGEDAPDTPADQAHMRQLALGWMQTNLMQLVRRVDTGAAGDRRAVTDWLTRWLTEKDFNGLRPGAARDNWSAAEAAEWDEFWANVQALLDKTNETISSTLPGK